MAILADPGDEAWRMLFDDDLLTNRRDAAEKKYRNLTGEHIRLMRRRAKTDAYFLASAVLGYDRLSEGLHGHYLAWLKATRGERYRMTLFPRDHYKSTTNTEVDSMQMALPCEDLQLPYPYSLGPNIKLLISHEVREMASRFLFKITKAFREKPLMLLLYPELIPTSRAQRMNKWELELPRDEHHAEPTFDTMGVGGAAQGRHYNWLKLDDLVGDDARDSETVMADVFRWFDNIYSLLTRPKFDGWDLIGTRWAATDVYSRAVMHYGVNRRRSILNAYDKRDREKMEEGELCIYARGAIENGQPIFPEEFPLKDLNRLRKRSPLVWASQYANNPREGGLTRFQPEWLKHYNIGQQDRLIVFDGEKGTRTVRTRDLDRLILIDPSMGERTKSDPSGIVVTGMDHKSSVYILETIKERLKPPQLIETMFRLYVKWYPRMISIEHVAFQGALSYWFKEKCQGLGVYPAMYEYKPGSQKSKTTRIEGLANYGAGGQLYCLEGMHELRDEWEWFPLSEEDHLLDALAQGPEIWQPGKQPTAVEDMKRAMSILEEERDELTGY